MRCRFNCQIYYTIYIIFTEFFKINVWYYNVTHLYEVDYRLLRHISSFLYEIFMELFLSRQNDQIAPVLDTCGWHCVVTPVSSGVFLFLYLTFPLMNIIFRNLRVVTDILGFYFTKSVRSADFRGLTSAQHLKRGLH